MKKLFVLLLLASMLIGLHASFKFAEPTFRFKLFKSDTEAAMRVHFISEKRILKKWTQIATENKIPIKEGWLDIWTEERGKFIVTVKYSVTVNYYDLYQKTFDFELKQQNF